jgi:hypothetical protein
VRIGPGQTGLSKQSQKLGIRPYGFPSLFDIPVILIQSAVWFPYVNRYKYGGGRTHNMLLIMSLALPSLITNKYILWWTIPIQIGMSQSSYPTDDYPW